MKAWRDKNKNAAAALLADMGGTYTRCAILNNGKIERVEVQANKSYDGPAALLEAYLRQLPGEIRPRQAALAIAAPVRGDEVQLTNLDWSFSIAKLRRQLRLDTLEAVNDFTAVALAVPHLGPAGVAQIGSGRALPDAAIGVLGPGTGLGVSGLLPCAGGWTPITGEGGHVTLAPASREESDILATLRERYGHVSAERVLSGPGLTALFACLAGEEATAVHSPELLIKMAVTEHHPLARRTLDHFFAFLGTTAGNLALTLGARGGIYLAGGILPRLVDNLKASAFRERFTGKGRFRDYLEAIPTLVVIEPHPALRGLAALLQPPPPDFQQGQ